jgi:hypothetical protein
MSKWTQELLYTRRDDSGHIVDIREELPEGAELETTEGEGQHEEDGSTE